MVVESGERRGLCFTGPWHPDSTLHREPLVPLDHQISGGEWIVMWLLDILIIYVNISGISLSTLHAWRMVCGTYPLFHSETHTTQ